MNNNVYLNRRVSYYISVSTGGDLVENSDEISIFKGKKRLIGFKTLKYK